MPANIQDVLAYEIKKEIADRYFGFRKLIEEDTLDLKEKARQQSFILEKRISFDLIRMYVLLRDEEIIKAFLDEIGLHEKLYYDCYLTQSQTIKQRVFHGIRLHGFTWQGRFKNLIYEIYERLSVHVSQYCEKAAEMKELGETIEEEIALFQKNNDLGSIIGFLHSLGDRATHGHMQGALEPGIADKLQKKLSIQSPVQQTQKAVIQPLKPLSKAKPYLNKIIKKAYKLHGQDFQEFFINRPSTSPQVQRFSDSHRR